MMEQADINTCKMNDILALLRPGVSDFERSIRQLTGYWHASPTSRELVITTAVCCHLIEKQMTPWWRR
jgi:hypothetical protein